MSNSSKGAEARLEEEIIKVSEKIASLQGELEGLKEWEKELRTSLRVFSRLTSSSSIDTAVNSIEINVVEKHLPAYEQRLGRFERAPRTTPIATGKAALAGQTLREMLAVKGDYMRPIEAVSRLRIEHGITIGPGVVGRETSDLSAALGAGKVPGLYVTRQTGWGLEEWNGKPPGAQSRRMEETAAPAPTHQETVEAEHVSPRPYPPMNNLPQAPDHE